MRYLIISLLVIASSCGPLFAQSFILQNAVVSFQIENAGITVNGKFDSLPSIMMTMNNNIVTNLNLSGSIAAHSINTGIGIRDKHLKKNDYFDVAQYPKIYLSSTHISGNGTLLSGLFNLRIKDITKAIPMEVSLTQNGKLVEVTGQCTINRLDFGLGTKSMILSENVRIKIHAVFNRIDK